MYPAQIVEIGKQISDFVAANGVLAFVIVMAALAMLAVFGGVVYALVMIVRLLGKQQDASAKRDERIDDVKVKVDNVVQSQDKVEDIVEKNNELFAALKASLDANTSLTGSTVKSYQTLEEQFVSSYDATSKMVGLTGADIKKNSDANTVKIIEAVNAISTTVAQQVQAPLEKVDQALSNLIETIKTSVTGLEQRAITAEAEKSVLQFRISQLQAVNSGTSADKDATEPLAKHVDPLSVEPVALSMGDGEKNREIIDAAQPAPEIK